MMDEEDATARLLRLAGARAVAPAERTARVREAVHARWRATIGRRVARRRTVAAVAVVAAAVAAIVIARLRPEPPPPVPARLVAHVEHVQGPFRFAAVEVREHAWVETNAAARVALRLLDGTSARLDTGSRLRFISARTIELAEGALYIDTGRSSAGVEVRTTMGTVRDIGTQFETRLIPGALQVRVRTGVVELQREGADEVTARAGTELIVRGRDAVTRPIAVDGREWRWVAAVGPRFEIEGRSVAVFAEHVAREQGWSLRYADAGVARDASSIILHGSVTGLDPDDALAAALATSSLQHEVRDGELLISRRARRGER